jgi:xylulose-5-phosphate/fructose-6-phosphate phosphoketolase
LELAIENEIDRFSLAMEAIRRVPKLQRIGGAAMEKFRNEQIACRNYAYEHGIDKPDVADWRWPHETRKAA